MAAYAALVSLSQTIDKLLKAQNRFVISPHKKEQLISIHKCTISLQGFLENFPAKGNSLERRIRYVANEAETIIEYFMWKQIDQGRNSISKSTLEPGSSGVSHLIANAAENIIRPFMRGQIDRRRNSPSHFIPESRGSEVSHPTGMCFGFKNLNEVTEEIESIGREVMDIKDNARSADDDYCVATGSSLSSSSRLIIAPPTSKDPSVGLEDDLMEIKGRLCGESYQLQVIPIFGMGGIGKTTLAKNAYYDQLILEHFPIRAWATVSQDYNASRILSSLLVSIGIEHSRESDESKMAEQVYKSLKGRRYLIVMDDMWNIKAWDDVRRIFPDDHNRSRILLTTRWLDVAAYPSSSSPIHEMRFMDADQSWNLLRKKVFEQGNCPCELKKIGKKIARSCRGLPLAIIVMAGLLSTLSPTPDSWEYIARNVNEIVNTKDEQFADTVLSLSYNHLPHHLRPCFLYMGNFPEDYEIRASVLIKLWVAEGFLKLPNGCKSFEEVAEEYLEDLVKRSLVLVMKRKSNGKIKSCSVHDLVRDLCMRKAQQEKFLLHVGREDVQDSLTNQRRISFAEFYPSFRDKISGLTSTIRSIICFSGRRDTIESLLIFSKNMRLLRVSQVVCHEPFWPALRLPFFFADEVFALFHLRYLSLKFAIEIPPAISKLENLQSLIIDPRFELTKPQPKLLFFPLEIWMVPQLRHLVSFGCYGLPDPPEGETMFGLKNLQTLSVANFICSERTVEMIPNLKELGITFLSSNDADVDYHLENLVHLQHLKKLKLLSYCEKLNHVHVFPRTLRELTLLGWMGLPWEEIGIVIGSLPNLEVLKLKNLPTKCGDKWETHEGKFLSLKFLLMKGHLCHWITESSHFPRLESLVLHHCYYLNEIPDSIGEISTLELIEIHGWNQSLWDSARRIQEEQQSWGNDALQVRLS